jgi:hypothetical protein
METPGNYNYKRPDPSWDYAEVYDQASVIQSDVANFIDWLSKNEESDTSCVAKEAREKLDDLIQQLTELRELF